MKKLIIFFAFLPLLSFGQSTYFPKDSITGDVMYSQIVEIAKTKDQLFTDSKAWVSDAFNSYKGVVEIEDREAGKIVVKGQTDIPRDGPLDSKTLTFRVTIDSRDNKFRSVIDNVKTEWTVMNFPPIVIPVTEMDQKDLDHKETITYKDKKQKKPIPDRDYERIQRDKAELQFIAKTLEGLEKSIKAKLTYIDNF